MVLEASGLDFGSILSAFCEVWGGSGRPGTIKNDGFWILGTLMDDLGSLLSLAFFCFLLLALAFSCCAFRSIAAQVLKSTRT